MRFIQIIVPFTSPTEITLPRSPLLKARDLGLAAG